MGWIIVEGETWILETNHEWDGGYECVEPKTLNSKCSCWCE